MSKKVKIILVVVLLGATGWMWLERSGSSDPEILPGYNEKEAEARFEEVKDEFKAAPLQSAAGVNPAHGEPGHRCDIPVGASLSTPPKSNSASGVMSSPSAGKMLNPAHGQPGHRCDIAVGAPLPL